MAYSDFSTLFWRDPWVRKLSKDAKILFTYLWTNDHKNNAGLYHLDIETMSFESGLTAKEVTAALQSIEPKVLYDHERQVVLVLNYVRHAFLKTGKIGPTQKKGIERCLPSFYGHPFLARFLEYYAFCGFEHDHDRVSVGYAYPIDTLCIGYAYPTGKGKGGEEDKEEKGGPGEKEEEGETKGEASRIAALMLTEILKANPKSRLHALQNGEKERTINGWAQDIELLIREDKQEPSTVEEVIKFATHDDFWGSNILSGRKLREKWDQLIGAMKRARKPVSPQNRGSPRPRIDEGPKALQDIFNRLGYPEGTAQ